MASPEPENWISAMEVQERERRERSAITGGAARRFRSLLSDQINSDLEHYFKAFPNERAHIQISEAQGASKITRLRDETSTYEDILPAVVFSIEINALVLQCHFTHRDGMGRRFPLAIRDDGAVGLASGTIASLSEYLLAPVLFNKLPRTRDRSE